MLAPFTHSSTTVSAGVLRKDRAKAYNTLHYNCPSLHHNRVPHTILFITTVYPTLHSHDFTTAPQCGATDAEIKVPLKSHLLRTQSLKPRVGPYIAMHAALIAKDYFLISTLLVHSPAFFQNPSRVFSALAVASTPSCSGQKNKVSHPAGCRFPC